LVPVGSALIATFSPPARLADAEVLRSIARSMAKSVMAVQVAGRLVAEVALPPALADARLRVVDASSVKTSGPSLASVAVLAEPAVVADALVGLQAVAVGAVVAARNVAVGPLPAVHAVAFKGSIARAVNAPWAQSYKTFYARNLRVFIISSSVCP
jgi:hypothetical protein